MVTKSTSQGNLVPPAPKTTSCSEERTKWLDEVIKGFVAKGQANRDYYAAILKKLWPENHGIPGPHVKGKDIREAVIDFRLSIGKSGTYHDVFRRVRELQGEEGIIGIIKSGNSYQLQSLDIAPKKIPREQIDATLWNEILNKTGNKCSVCGNVFPNNKLSPDHRIPRSVGGDNSIDNWQPLCRTCNATKSAVCQGCDLDCYTCSWAWPEKYKPIKINKENDYYISKMSMDSGNTKSSIVNSILEKYFKC